MADTSKLKWVSSQSLDFGCWRWSSFACAAPRIMDLMHLAKIAGGIVVGNFVFERFILKNPVDGSGFVEVKEGFGMDDIIRAATVAAVVVAVEKFLPGGKG